MRRQFLSVLLAMALIFAIPLSTFSQGGCVVAPSGVNNQTSSYLAAANDVGKLIVMNCASACTLTLPAVPPTNIFSIWYTSIGAGALTIAPNGVTLYSATSPSGTTSSFTALSGYISTNGTSYWLSVDRGFGSIPSQFYWSNANTITSLLVLYGPMAFATPVLIPTNGANGTGASSFVLGTAPTATWTATVYRIPYNGSGNPACSGTPSSIGTISVTTSNIATFTITQTVFTQGDCLEVVAPSSVDTTAANPIMTLYLLK